MKKLLVIGPLLAVAAIALIFGISVSIFYAWTDWTGARGWKVVETNLRAKGEPLTIAEIEPKPIPDERNFAAAPIFAEITHISDQKKWRLSAIQGLTGVSDAASSLLVKAARKIDPKFAGTDHDAAELVLSETAKWKPLLDEVREAAKRPDTLWPSDYHAGFRMKMPQISILLRLAQTLSTEARANLELKNPAAALADFQLLLNLANRSDRPSNAIAYLVGHAMVSNAIDTVRFGLERRAWPATALETIQRSLSEVSLPPKLATGLRSERVFFLDSLSTMSAQEFYESLNGSGAIAPKRSPSLLGNTIWYLRPAGWILEDRVAYSNTLQPVIEWLESTPPFRPEKIPSPEETIQKLKEEPLSSLRTPLARSSLAAILGATRVSIYTQARIGETLIACSIERYRLAHGSLPISLESLVPAFASKLPGDPIYGSPFHYRVTGLDSYLLYSVGWNGIDNGGSEKRPTIRSLEKGEDWVWKMEAPGKEKPL